MVRPVRQRRRRVWIGAGLFVLAVGAGLYSLSLILREDVHFRSGELAYYVLVAPYRTMRTFPLYGALRHSVRYEYDAADGPAPARVSCVFTSTATGEALLHAYAAHCPPQREGPWGTTTGNRGLQCHAPGYHISIAVDTVENGTAVLIVFEEE